MAVCVFFEAAERIIDRGPRFPPRIRTTSVHHHRAGRAYAARFHSRVVALVDTIAVPFFFPSFRAFLSAIPSIPIFLSSCIALCAECMNPIFVKVTRGTIAVNRREATADLRVSQLETRERRETGLCSENFDNKEISSKQKTRAVFLF